MMTKAPAAPEEPFVTPVDPTPHAPTQPEMAVVIPAWNAAPTLAEQLDALVRQDFAGSWELVVVDDGSSDRTVAIAEGYADRLPLRVISTGRVRGPAYARNVGAAATTAPRLGFVDADDVVADDWLRIVRARLEDHAAVASRFDDERLNAPEVRASRTLGQRQGLAKDRYGGFLPHAGGCGLAVRREVHDGIGGFDERLPRLEDTDYCWRLQLAGWTLSFAPDAVVHVRFRQRTGAALRQVFAYGRINGWLYHRYRPRGMHEVSWWHEARGMLRGLLALPTARPASTRVRRLRTVVRHLGTLLGRIEASTGLRP